VSQYLDDLDELFSDVISYRKALARDQYGKVTSWTASATIKARVYGKAQRISGPGGQEVASNVEAILKGKPGIKPGDEVTLPSHFSPNQPPVLAVGQTPDEDGLLYEKLYF
jgi:hypothetical protein